MRKVHSLIELLGVLDFLIINLIILPSFNDSLIHLYLNIL
jgi:hypothetical protein